MKILAVRMEIWLFRATSCRLSLILQTTLVVVIPLSFGHMMLLFHRDVALEILSQEDIGSFIVRDSSTHPGCYALSVRVPKFENPTGISHYLILKTQRGVKLKVRQFPLTTVVSDH